MKIQMKYVSQQDTYELQRITNSLIDLILITALLPKKNRRIKLSIMPTMNFPFLFDSKIRSHVLFSIIERIKIPWFRNWTLLISINGKIENGSNRWREINQTNKRESEFCSMREKKIYSN